jgi:transcription factor IIIB subunit 2
MNMSLSKLGRCFLKLYKFLEFHSQIPLIDPSLYIPRYCKALDLASKTKDVIHTAIKLIQRMQRDWMCQGRRPSSLCGAAILIATKIHDVRCSTADICKTVFVCDETIRRRLEEFKKTSVAKLTKEEFERMEEDNYEGPEMDPPAFQKARLKSLGTL